MADRVDVLVIGAGMVGAATAYHAVTRGMSVRVIDAGGPLDKASHGNAGVISRGSILPLSGPGIWSKLVTYGLNRDPALRIDHASLPALAPWLVGFLKRANETDVRAAAAALNPLCAAAYDDHMAIARTIGAAGKIARRGWLKLYRSDEAFAGTVLERDLYRQHGVAFEVIDGQELRQFEPALLRAYARATWFPETGAVDDPGGLVRQWLEAARGLGAVVSPARVSLVESLGDHAVAHTEEGTVTARHVVIATGAAADTLTRAMGYRFPLAAERGYHRHFKASGDHGLARPIYDTGGHFVISPMARGLRLLSGVELARRDAPATPYQINRIEPDARQCVAMGESLDDEAWMGARPSTPDGLPVIGPAPRHPRVWFAFGHGHIGLATGPITGRAIVYLIRGEVPPIALAPFSAERFMGKRG